MKDFHTFAHQYIGLQFRHHGRTRDGVDCVGLIIICAQDCGYTGYTPNEEFEYSKQPRTGQLRAVIERHLGKPINEPPQVNDVVLMTINNAEVHCGIITTHPHGIGIIHAYGSVKKVVYHRWTDEMEMNLADVYRWKNAN